MLKLNLSSGRAIGQLELPAPLDELKQRVNEIHMEGQVNTAPAVLNADSPVPALNWHLQGIRLDDDILQKLNQLAETIDGMNAAGRYYLSKSLDQEIQQELDDVFRLAAHIKTSSLDCCEVIPGVTSHQELGKWLVEHDRLEDRAPEALRPYLDYRSIGIDYCNEHEGEFLADGYTGIRSGAVEQVMEEQGVLHLTLSTAKGTFPLSFPASDERLEQAKRALDVEDFAQAEITALKSSTPYLTDLIPLDAVTVEDANTLALCLKEMEQEDGEAGISKSRFWAYLLVQDVEDAKDRAVALKRMGVEPFAQPYRDYDGGEPTQLQKQFAHWVNQKSVFHSCTWEEFKK